MITHEYVHVVAGSYFRSFKKDGGHATRLPVCENPMLHTHFNAVCVTDAELLAMECLHYAEADLSWHACIRCACTCCGSLSILWPWPWLDSLHIRTWPVLPGDTRDVQMYTFCVKSFKCYHLTDRQTESTDIINHATSWVANKQPFTLSCNIHSCNPKLKVSPQTSALNRGTPCRRRKFDQSSAIARKRCTLDGQLLLNTHIGNRMRAFDRYRKWWPWMTLNGVMAVIFCYSTKVCSFGANYVKVVEIRLMPSATKMLQNLVFGSLWFMVIFSEITQKLCATPTPER